MDVRYIGFPPQSDFLKFPEVETRFKKKKKMGQALFMEREPVKLL